MFTTVYGIGPTNARKLYDLGLRDIQDLEHYFDAPSNSSDIKLGLEDADVAGNDAREQLTIKVALALREELTETYASTLYSSIVDAEHNDSHM